MWYHGNHHTHLGPQATINYNHGSCLFCIRNTEQAIPVEQNGDWVWPCFFGRHSHSLPWCSLGAPPPPDQPLATARDELHLVPHSLCTGSCRNLPKHPRPVYTCLTNACSNWHFPRSKFLPIPWQVPLSFSSFLHYWVRGQLCHRDSLLPPSCVFSGLSSGRRGLGAKHRYLKDIFLVSAFFHFKKQARS